MTTRHHHRGDPVMTLTEELRPLIEALEAMHDAEGWDQPARLYRIRRHDDGFDLDPVRLEMFSDDPVESVQMIAYAMQHVDLLPAAAREALLPTLLDSPAVAYCSVHEGWGRAFTPEEVEARRAEADPRSLADIPGSVEVRFAAAVVDDTILTYFHTRGEAPMWADDRPVTDEVVEHERLTGALVDLSRADARMATL